MCLEFYRLNICFALQMSGHCILDLLCVFRLWYPMPSPVCLLTLLPLRSHTRVLNVCLYVFFCVLWCLCESEYDFQFMCTCNINIKYPFWCEQTGIGMPTYYDMKRLSQINAGWWNTLMKKMFVLIIIIMWWIHFPHMFITFRIKVNASLSPSLLNI